jgi:hypothetical protein
MPSKTQGELIAELQNEVTKLHERLNAAKAEVERADLVRIRERLSVVENQLAELAKRREEDERKRWQLWVTAIGCALGFLSTLVMNVVLLVLK